MKRTLLIAAAIYLIYERQRRVEGRLKLWKLGTDADLRSRDSELLDWCGDVVQELERRAEQDMKWSRDLIGRVEWAFKEGAR